MVLSHNNFVKEQAGDTAVKHIGCAKKRDLCYNPMGWMLRRSEKEVMAESLGGQNSFIYFNGNFPSVNGCYAKGNLRVVNLGKVLHQRSTKA